MLMPILLKSTPVWMFPSDTRQWRSNDATHRFIDVITVNLWVNFSAMILSSSHTYPCLKQSRVNEPLIVRYNFSLAINSVFQLLTVDSDWVILFLLVLRELRNRYQFVFSIKLHYRTLHSSFAYLNRL